MTLQSEITSSGVFRMLTTGEDVYFLTQEGGRGKVTVARVETHPDSTMTLTRVDQWWTWSDATYGAEYDASQRAQKAAEIREIQDLLDHPTE